MTLDHRAQIEFGQTVLKLELEAIQELREKLDCRFAEVVQLILHTNGSVVVSGLGKSGHVGRKISATLASTGTPSHYLYPTEAFHGDFGSVASRDILLLLSFSGQTEEVIALAEHAKHSQIPIASITGNPDSALSKLSDHSIPIGDLIEACPHNLAPTASTTAMLALGDAIALTASRCRGFTKNDFNRLHLGGHLGRLTQSTGTFVARRDKRPAILVPDNMTIEEVIKCAPANTRRGGAILLIDSERHLTGIFTDADLRRLIIREGPSCLQLDIKDRMTREPISLHDHDTMGDAAEIMMKHKIDELPIINSQLEPIGLIDVQDLVALGVTVQTD